MPVCYSTVAAENLRNTTPHGWNPVQDLQHGWGCIPQPRDWSYRVELFQFSLLRVGCFGDVKRSTVVLPLRCAVAP